MEVWKCSGKREKKAVNSSLKKDFQIKHVLLGQLKEFSISAQTMYINNLYKKHLPIINAV